MQWVRSNVTLRPEEKQFGPWLRATPDRVQKPQTITATTNGESKTMGGERETSPEQRGGEAIPRRTTTQPGSVKYSGMTREVGFTRANLVKVADTPTNAQPKPPVHLQTPNFEQKLQDIDAAIQGAVPVLISEPCKEMILTGKENTQAHTDSSWVKEEWAKASGPDKENQNLVTVFGPQDSQLTQGKTRVVKRTWRSTW